MVKDNLAMSLMVMQEEYNREIQKVYEGMMFVSQYELEVCF